MLGDYLCLSASSPPLSHLSSALPLGLGSPLALAASLFPPPPHPKTPPNFPFRRRTLLLLEASPVLARAWPLRLLVKPRLLNLASFVDGKGDDRNHDGPVDKAKLATVSTTLLGSTGRNPENERVVRSQAAAFLQQGDGGSCTLMPPFSARR